MNALVERYTQIQPKLEQELGISNRLALPKLTKVVINVGLGDLRGNEPLQKNVTEGLGLITGQKPVPTRAKRAIAGFKIRQNDLIGYTVTLRGKRMYDFLDRLITYVFPRLRDFQGIAVTGFDKHGNFSFGLKEQTVFPEIPYETSDKNWGMQITIVTTAHDNAGAKLLLQELGFPLVKEEK